MHRPRSASCTLVVLASLVALASACSNASEQQLLQKYFNAAKLRDHSTLANIATVRFNPETDGIVQSLTITKVGNEQKRTLRLRELRKTFDEAKAAEEEFSKRKKAYQDANIETIDRVIKAERLRRTVKGKELEVQTAWVKWRDDMARHAKMVNDARSQLATERSSVDASIFDPRKPVDASAFDAEIARKDVTLDAQVQSPSGQVQPKTLLVTLEKATLKNDKDKVNGRWIIVSIRDAAAAPGQKS